MRTLTGTYLTSVLLHCPQCGRTYIRRKECYNQRQASSWCNWMMRNYKGVCPDCYRSRKMA